MEKHATLRKNAKYCMLQGLHWMISCVAIIFASVFLLGRGYRSSEVGITMACAYILGMLLQPFISGLADRSVRLRGTPFLALCAAVTMLPVAGLLLFTQKGAALTICYVLFVACQQTLTPLVYAYCFYLETPQTPIRFGIARGIGSLAWSVASTVLGILADRVGVQVLPCTALMFLALMQILLFFCRKEGGAAAQAAAEQAQPERAASTLTLRNLTSIYRPFLFLLIGNAFIFFGHSFIDNFPFQIVSNVGGTSAQMGVFCAFTAAAELPAMFLFDRIRRRFSCEKLLRFGAVFFLVKNTLLFLASSLTGMFFAGVFQSVSYAVFHPAAVRYAGDHISSRDANKAQSLVTATTAAGNILASALGGVMIDAIGVHSMLAIGAAVTLCGVSVVVFGTRAKAAAPTA